MTEKTPTTAQKLEELFGKVDLEQLVKDEILKEGAEEIQRQYDRHLMSVLYGSSSYEENGEKYIIVHNDAYHKLTEATDNSFFGKLKYGWKLFALSWSDWKDAMYSEDYVEEFFEYLGSCEDL
jgi:hypothetical protein